MSKEEIGNTNSQQQSWKSRHIRDALFDAKYWVMLVFGICQSVTNAGVTNVSFLQYSGQYPLITLKV